MVKAERAALSHVSGSAQTQGAVMGSTVRRIAIVAVALYASMLTGCGAGGGKDDASEPTPVESAIAPAQLLESDEQFHPELVVAAGSELMNCLTDDDAKILISEWTRLGNGIRTAASEPWEPSPELREIVDRCMPERYRLSRAASVATIGAHWSRHGAALLANAVEAQCGPSCQEQMIRAQIEQWVEFGRQQVLEEFVGRMAGALATPFVGLVSCASQGSCTKVDYTFFTAGLLAGSIAPELSVFITLASIAQVTVLSIDAGREMYSACVELSHGPSCCNAEGWENCGDRCVETAVAYGSDDENCGRCRRSCAAENPPACGTDLSIRRTIASCEAGECHVESTYLDPCPNGLTCGQGVDGPICSDACRNASSEPPANHCVGDFLVTYSAGVCDARTGQYSFASQNTSCRDIGMTCVNATCITTCVPACTPPASCQTDGTCRCVPSCSGKLCGGDDGCGGACPVACAAPRSCREDGACKSACEASGCPEGQACQSDGTCRDLCGPALLQAGMTCCADHTQATSCCGGTALPYGSVCCEGRAITADDVLGSYDLVEKWYQPLPASCGMGCYTADGSVTWVMFAGTLVVSREPVSNYYAQGRLDWTQTDNFRGSAGWVYPTPQTGVSFSNGFLLDAYSATPTNGAMECCGMSVGLIENCGWCGPIPPGVLVQVLLAGNGWEYDRVPAARMSLSCDAKTLTLAGGTVYRKRETAQLRSSR